MKLNLSKAEESALKEFAEKALKKFKDRILFIKLFGSKARGDFNEYSDLDVLILVDRADVQISKGIISIAFETSLKYKVYISAKIIGREEFSRLSKIGTTFTKNIEKEGVGLYA